MALVSLSEVKVGIMVVLSIVLLTALTISVGNLQDAFADTIRLQIVAEKVDGLENYAPVTYEGVRIGRVMNIFYDQEAGASIVEAEISRTSPVALDSEAQLTMTGMLTPLTVNFSSGTKEQRLLTLLEEGAIQPGEPIRIKAKPYASFNDVFALANDARSTIERVNAMIEGLNEPIAIAGSLIKDISSELKTILHNVDTLIVKGDALLVDFLDSATGLIQEASGEAVPALKDLRLAASKFPAIAENIQARLDSVLANADGMISEARPEVSGLIKDVRESVHTLQDRIVNVENAIVNVLNNADKLVVENHSDVVAIMDYLRRTSKNLDSISSQIEKNPWRLVWKTDEPERPSRVSPDWKPAALEP